MRRIGWTLALTGLLALRAADAATPPTPVEFARYADALLVKAYPTDGPGAAVLVMRGDEVLYRHARGRADVAAGVPLQPGDRFPIASVTKQFAAAGLLTLVDAGKVSLDDTISKYLPNYPGGARITIEQLLNHTSGIMEYTSIPGTFDGPIRRHVTTAQLVDYFKDETPEFAPGEAWSYNNSGYVLVGAVIETASGQPWHRYLDQVLFGPLGMDDTGYGADPAVTRHQVKGYTTDRGVPAPPLQLSMTQPHAAGALVSTVDDLARWNRGLHQGHVLAPANYVRMITPTGQAEAYNYGYGIYSDTIRGVQALQHGGGIAGFGSYLIYLRDADVTIAVLNNDETPPPAHEPHAVARRLAAAVLGDPYPAVVPAVLDAAVLKQYEGVYRVDPGGTRTLRLVDGVLTAYRNGGRREPLTPVAVDTFVYPDGFARLQVLRDRAGRVTAMRFWPDGEGDALIAPLTDQAVPIDLGLPRDAVGRLASRFLVPILLVGAVIAVLYAGKLWRRRRRAAGTA